MTTRQAAEGSPFHQERYSSSTSLEKGLNSVLVKNRCAILSDPREIELVWFIQYQSMQQGGLEKFTANLLSEFPEHLGTPAMLQIGKREGIYNADQVRSVRSARGLFYESEFPLGGEIRRCFGIFTAYSEDQLQKNPGLAQTVKAIDQRKIEHRRELEEESKTFPTSYPVMTFRDICRDKFNKEVPELLTQFCLDPGINSDGLQVVTDDVFRITVFHDLLGALYKFMERWETRHLAKMAITEVGKKVIDAMEYSEAERALVLIEGVYGTGKTFPAKVWCEARPGKRRYIQCPSSNDSLDFFRTIAEPLGVSNALSMKGTQMRSRVNDVLQAGHLSIVIDESHYLFPQASTRVALPGRVNWVMTALTNYNVPVVLVATPQFMSSRATVERNTFWAAGQLDGRISRYIPLPEELEESDLRAISRMHLPDGDEKSISTLVQYALASKKRLRGIEHLVKSARHVARWAGRDKVTFADIKQAMKDNLMPSDSALNTAFSKAVAPTKAGRRQRDSKIYVEASPEPSQPISAPDPERNLGAELIVTPDRKNMRSGNASLSTA